MTWCHVPQMASAYAQEPVALIWASCLQSQTSTRAALSSGRITPAAQSSPPSGPDTSPQPRSGMMSQPLTGAPSEEPLIPSSPDTHASRSAWQDSARGQTTSATFGPMSPASSARLSLDGSFSKTSRDTSPLALKPCCENYGTWVSRLRLAYSQRVKQGRRTKGNGSSSWPTARVQSANGAGGNQQGGKDLQTTVEAWPTPTAHSFAQTIDNPTPGQTGGTTLAGAAELQWQTPVSDDAADRAIGKVNSRGEPKLSEQAHLWGTPRASDAEKGGPNQAFGSGGTPLPAQAAQWPTPAARDHKGENSPDHLTNGTGRLHMDQLPNAVAFGFSRPDPVTVQAGLPPWQWRPTSRRLLRSVTLHVAQRSLDRWLRQGNWKKRRLNPLFVEWLMGWPKGHALCASSAMEWSHWQQRMRGALSALPMASGPWIWAPPQQTEQPQMQADLFGGMV